MTKLKAPASLIVSLGLSFSAAAIGSIGTLNAIDGWYEDAVKPWFTPPNWAFGPAWTIWYTLMAIAAWQVWNAESKWRRPALIAYFAQLVLNALWPVVFFGLKMLELGFWVAVALAVAVFVTMCLFHLTKKSAGISLAPYWGWCVFASCLSYGLLINNI